MNATSTRLFAAICSVVAILLTGCVQKRLAVSDEFAPISLCDNRPVARIAQISGYVEMADIEYRWRTQSGQVVHAEAVAREVLNFLGTPGFEAGLARQPASEASWYWSPDTSQTRLTDDQSTEPLVTARRDTVIILGLQPTVALRVERPTENSSTGSTFPWHRTEWWGWQRIMLPGGIADGRLVPTTSCPSTDFADAELVIPTLGLRHQIDLYQSGSFDWGSGSATWECVTMPDGRNGILFDLAGASAQAKVAAD